MDTSALLLDGFTRIREEVYEVLDGLSEDDLNAHVGIGTNSVAWLVWHLTRVQDDHVSDAAGLDQVWTAEGFDERFGLDLPSGSTGFGHSPREVAKVYVAGPALLAEYYEAVHARSEDFLRGLDDSALDEVVDASWDPPTTLGVRLISVLADNLQHVGQAAFLKGVLQRR